MSTTTFTRETTLATIDCGSCGGVYAITERHRQYCSDHGETWTCPYCKTGWGFSESSLKKQLERAESERDIARSGRAAERGRADREERRARAFKGQVTRIKRRVGNGVCPCCNRTFEDLARHMKSKHPDYSEAS